MNTGVICIHCVYSRWEKRSFLTPKVISKVVNSSLQTTSNQQLKYATADVLDLKESSNELIIVPRKKQPSFLFYSYILAPYQQMFFRYLSTSIQVWTAVFVLRYVAIYYFSSPPFLILKVSFRTSLIFYYKIEILTKMFSFEYCS